VIARVRKFDVVIHDGAVTRKPQVDTRHLADILLFRELVSKRGG
jgi:hypothetical protein